MEGHPPFQHHLLILGDASVAPELHNSFKAHSLPLELGGPATGDTEHTPNGAACSTRTVQAVVQQVQQCADEHSNITSTILISAKSGDSADDLVHVIAQLRQALPSSFIILWHPNATENAHVRSEAFIAGANMVTYCRASLSKVLSKVQCQQGTGNVSCAWCNLGHLTQQDYWLHQPLYHIYAKERPTHCGVCDKQVANLPVHVHEEHAPGGPRYESRTNYGNAIVVHRPTDNKFLMVQEFAHQGFWTPGGCADPGETLSASAVRECLEETGVDVEIKGLLEVQHDMAQVPPWRLAVFYAQPIDLQQVPKTVPDYESAGACWVSTDELGHIPLRCRELPYRWFPDIVNGTVQLLPADKVPEHATEQFRDLTM